MASLVDDEIASEVIHLDKNDLKQSFPGKFSLYVLNGNKVLRAVHGKSMKHCKKWRRDWFGWPRGKGFRKSTASTWIMPCEVDLAIRMSATADATADAEVLAAMQRKPPPPQSTPEELGAMAGKLLDIAFGDSDGSEADSINERFLFAMSVGGTSVPMSVGGTSVPMEQTTQPGRCYTDTAKADLVAILIAGIKAIKAGYIGDAGDFGLLALRLASACEQFDGLPNPGDGEKKLIDGMVNEWSNPHLETFLDTQLNTAAK